MGPMGYPCLVLQHLDQMNFDQALRILSSGLFTYSRKIFDILKLSHHDIYELSLEPRHLTQPVLRFLASLWIQWISEIKFNDGKCEFHCRFPPPSYLDEPTLLKHLEDPEFLLPVSAELTQKSFLDYELLKPEVGIDLGFALDLKGPLLKLLQTLKSHDNVRKIPLWLPM